MRALRATRIAVVHDKLGTKKMWKMQISIIFSNLFTYKIFNFTTYFFIFAWNLPERKKEENILLKAYLYFALENIETQCKKIKK